MHASTSALLISIKRTIAHGASSPAAQAEAIARLSADANRSEDDWSASLIEAPGRTLNSCPAPSRD
jgi:hypothetical protein